MSLSNVKYIYLPRTQSYRIYLIIPHQLFPWLQRCALVRLMSGSNHSSSSDCMFYQIPCDYRNQLIKIHFTTTCPRRALDIENNPVDGRQSNASRMVFVEIVHALITSSTHVRLFVFAWGYACACLSAVYMFCHCCYNIIHTPTLHSTHNT